MHHLETSTSEVSAGPSSIVIWSESLTQRFSYPEILRDSLTQLQSAAQPSAQPIAKLVKPDNLRNRRRLSGTTTRRRRMRSNKKQQEEEQQEWSAAVGKQDKRGRDNERF